LQYQDETPIALAIEFLEGIIAFRGVLVEGEFLEFIDKHLREDLSRFGASLMWPR
jgi:hypothetical protein